MEYSFDPPERFADPWIPVLVGDRFASQQLCGRSFNRGLLRFHDSRSGPIGQELVEKAFRPRHGLQAHVFAYDWLARQFAVTSSLTSDGAVDRAGASRTVVVLDPFDMSITPWVDADQFEKALGVPLAQEQLHPTLFESWRLDAGVDRLTLDHCAGATVPAFYGGKRELSNLRHDDIDVFLTFTLQLWAYWRSRPPGSPPPRLRLPSDE